MLRNSGELTWYLAQVGVNYLKDNGKSFQNISEVIGALECAKAELQRRLVGPYEDEKIATNGDLDWGDIL